jgi:solute carrier family 30 (zinc transporter), member 9
MKVGSPNPDKPIIVAIIANSIIAVSKGIGYFFSGSNALLSEAIHSVADVMNQSLLLLGIKRGKKGENDFLNYGYSQERFFWNLISAMGIFVLGCGVTVYHGFHELLENHGYKEKGIEQIIIIVILVLSFIVELYSLRIVLHEIRLEAKSRNKKLFSYLRESIDPSVSAVFWEDAAALLGIGLALIGILLTELTKSNTFDSIASILIGFLMGWIAIHLAVENKKFLVDRSIPQHELNQIYGLLKNNKAIKSIDNVKSVVFGPDRLKIRMDIDLDLDLIYKKEVDSFLIDLKNAGFKDMPIDKIRAMLKEYNQNLHQIRIQTNQEIQKSLAEQLPNLKHIDII